MNVLVTGGAGYIGSHTTLALMRAGHHAVVVDNLSNSKAVVLERVRELADGSGKLSFYKDDVRDRAALERIFDEVKIDAVIHFAGLKAVGESVREPLRYYDNNLISTLVLLEVMQSHGVNKLVFSSSATVYGDPEEVPIKETAKTWTTNPYGSTKLMIENILRDTAKAGEWHIALLRYFNPIGADASGRIGEDPNGIPNNLMPYISQVAVGKLERLSVFGDDYPTHDGTGVRDYIHVSDLAHGHLCALDNIDSINGAEAFNLGTGTGYSVLDILHAMEEAVGKELPYRIAPRRAGDIAECYADASKAHERLGWSAQRGLAEMCRDSWNWQKNNPDGYGE